MLWSPQSRFIAPNKSPLATIRIPATSRTRYCYLIVHPAAWLSSDNLMVGNTSSPAQSFLRVVCLHQPKIRQNSIRIKGLVDRWFNRAVSLCRKNCSPPHLEAFTRFQSAVRKSSAQKKIKFATSRSTGKCGVR